MQYEFHEVANIFPMMSDTEFAGLVEDMRVNGQLEPIWIHQQKIIDGRNRYNACLAIGIEPVVKEWDGRGSLVDFAVSKNFHRRQLNASQRAMVGARIKHIFEDDAKLRMLATQNNNTADQLAQKKANREIDRYSPNTEKSYPSDTGKSSSKAAKLVNSSQSSVEAATRVIRNAIPEVAEAVEKGQVTVTKADTISKLPKDQQPEILKKVIANEPILKRAEVKPTRLEPPKGFLPDPEGSEKLHEILSNICETLGLLVGHAETELINLPKNTVKESRYRVGGCIDAIHKSAERLEIFYKMYK